MQWVFLLQFLPVQQLPGVHPLQVQLKSDAGEVIAPDFKLIRDILRADEREVDRQALVKQL